MAAQLKSFRVGRVRAYLRGQIWYLAYQENSRRRQPRVGPDRQAAKQLAAEINSQLEVGAPSALGFQAVSIAELRRSWLEHHELIRRSSLATIVRYRTATQHFIDFVDSVQPLKRASDLRTQHVTEFVRFLRQRRVSPNGHRKARRRPLRDAGIKFILETCCSLFNFALRQRHLPPYGDNPFRTIEVCRIPVEDATVTVPLAAQQEVAMLKACDDWQFPIYLTMLCTGLRPGELVHLLLPDDLDLAEGWLRVRNKAALGWQVKTRNERDLPLIPCLWEVLRGLVKERTTGPVFLQRRCFLDHQPKLLGISRRAIEQQVSKRVATEERDVSTSLTRTARQAITRSVWRDLGALKEDWIRKEFMQITRSIGLAELTAPKLIRHTFATILQEGEVDPLVRNELMGHSPFSAGLSGQSLGMTAVYTHTRPETKRKCLEKAFASRPATVYAVERLHEMLSKAALSPIIS